MTAAALQSWAAFLQGRQSLASLGTKPNRIPANCAGSGVPTAALFFLSAKHKLAAGRSGKHFRDQCEKHFKKLLGHAEVSNTGNDVVERGPVQGQALQPPRTVPQRSPVQLRNSPNTFHFSFRQHQPQNAPCATPNSHLGLNLEERWCWI